mmetsp:Transcript_58750/g.108420  ORF Transcript_58750/g.108420 Transcript_58750/m.108420 type:complete len:408 (-) Transcript_58750:36-1259(-)
MAIGSAALFNQVIRVLQDLPLTLIVVAVLVLVVVLWCWPQPKEPVKYVRASASQEPYQTAGTAEADQDEPHVNIINASPTWPRNVVYRNNPTQPCPFDSGACHGVFLALHKPTHDPRLLASGDYPYGNHMHGRKRLWEFRLQMHFRRRVDGPIFVGVEQLDYQKVGSTQQATANILVRALQRATGGLYQSYGDDPDTTQGELERPHVVFPLATMMDQLIVTEEGETPPDLTDPQFTKLGLTKANNRGKFKKAIESLELVPGPTFTFGFWGIAQFLDTILWRAPARGVMPEIKLTKIGIIPPGFMVMYALPEQTDNFVSPPASPRAPPPLGRSNSTSSIVSNVDDGRHLDSRKQYLWRTAFWSTVVQPDPKRMKDILPEVVKNESRKKGGDKSKTASTTVRHRWCCGI